MTKKRYFSNLQRYRQPTTSVRLYFADTIAMDL